MDTKPFTCMDLERVMNAPKVLTARIEDVIRIRAIRLRGDYNPSDYKESNEAFLDELQALINKSKGII